MYYSKDKICEAFMNNLLLEDVDYKDLIAQVDDGESDIDTINYFKDQIKQDKHLPILLNLDKEVIDGNHRLKAYQELNIKPPLLYMGDRADFFRLAPECDYDGVKIINRMIEDGLAVKV